MKPEDKKIIEDIKLSELEKFKSTWFSETMTHSKDGLLWDDIQEWAKTKIEKFEKSLQLLIEASKIKQYSAYHDQIRKEIIELKAIIQFIKEEIL